MVCCRHRYFISYCINRKVCHRIGVAKPAVHAAVGPNGATRDVRSSMTCGRACRGASRPHCSALGARLKRELITRHFAPARPSPPSVALRPRCGAFADGRCIVAATTAAACGGGSSSPIGLWFHPLPAGASPPSVGTLRPNRAPPAPSAGSRYQLLSIPRMGDATWLVCAHNMA